MPLSDSVLEEKLAKHQTIVDHYDNLTGQLITCPLPVAGGSCGKVMTFGDFMVKHLFQAHKITSRLRDAEFMRCGKAGKVLLDMIAEFDKIRFKRIRSVPYLAKHGKMTAVALSKTMPGESRPVLSVPSVQTADVTDRVTLTRKQLTAELDERAAALIAEKIRSGELLFSKHQVKFCPECSHAIAHHVRANADNNVGNESLDPVMAEAMNILNSSR